MSKITESLYRVSGGELNESLGIDWTEGRALEDSYLHLNWYEFYDDEYHRTYYAATDGEAFEAMIWPVGGEYDITAELGSKTLYDNRIHLGDDDEAINFVENLFMEKVVLPNADIDESLNEAVNHEGVEQQISKLEKQLKNEKDEKKRSFLQATINRYKKQLNNKSLNESAYDMHDGGLRDEFYSLIEGMDAEEVVSWLLSYINDYDLDELIRDAKRKNK